MQLLLNALRLLFGGVISTVVVLVLAAGLGVIVGAFAVGFRAMCGC